MGLDIPPPRPEVIQTANEQREISFKWAAVTAKTETSLTTQEHSCLDWYHVKFMTTNLKWAILPCMSSLFTFYSSKFLIHISPLPSNVLLPQFSHHFSVNVSSHHQLSTIRSIKFYILSVPKLHICSATLHVVSLLYQNPVPSLGSHTLLTSSITLLLGSPLYWSTSASTETYFGVSH